jgi:DegV family protein with EDD domain
LVIHVGSEFSSTHKSVELAKSMLPAAPIHLVDSHSNAMGLGFQVLAVAREARKGHQLRDLIQLAEQARSKTGVVFYAEDISFLQRGGRINLGQRVLASLLNIVPVLQVQDGPITMVGRTRSRKNAINKMVEIVESTMQGVRPLRIAVHHSDNEKAAFELRRLVEEKLEPDELILEELTPILGVHLGPGALGLAYSIGL